MILKKGDKVKLIRDNTDLPNGFEDKVGTIVGTNGNNLYKYCVQIAPNKKSNFSIKELKRVDGKLDLIKKEMLK